MTGPMSIGTCNLCGKDFAKNVISRHIKKCLPKAYRQEQTASAGGKTQKTFWINVWGKCLPEYWLHLEAPAASKLEDLDAFLRNIWLECCGHLSAFTIGSTRYEMDAGMVDAMWKDFFGPSQPPQSMNVRLYTLLAVCRRTQHFYNRNRKSKVHWPLISANEAQMGAFHGVNHSVFLAAGALKNTPIRSSRCAYA